MEARNPYAAPNAPVVSADEPTRLPTDPENFEYGGFWRRVGAQLLDGIILIPMILLLYFLIYKTSRAYLYYALPSLAVQFFYYVYLVRRFGGTPGKRITSMRITMTDGAPVTMKAAVVRYLPYLVLQALTMLATVIATSAPVDGYDAMSFIEKMQRPQRYMPGWGMVVAWITYAWILVEAITLVANQRKRAAHDFIAGTVVLRTD